MKRTNPKGSEDPGFVRISWEEALATIASNLKAIKEKYGPEKILVFCGDPKEPRPAAMRLARYLGTYHYATESSVACRKGSLLAEQVRRQNPTWSWQLTAHGPNRTAGGT